MVEPKTQSILETIKKKLVKFESKNAEKKVDKLSSEFSEVVPVNKDTLLKTSNDNFNNTELPNQENKSNKNDLNKTEIDIDNESTINKNFTESISKNENKVIANYIEDFSEEDLEDYEMKLI